MNRAAKRSLSATSANHGSKYIQQTMASFWACNSCVRLATQRSAAFKCFLASERQNKLQGSQARNSGDVLRFPFSHLPLLLALICTHAFFQVERQLTEEQINGKMEKYLWKCNLYFDCNTTKLLSPEIARANQFHRSILFPAQNCAKRFRCSTKMEAALFPMKNSRWS